MAFTNRRVVVTGMGAVSPSGLSLAETWGNVVAGKSAIRTITQFDASEYACRIAGEVPEFDLSHLLDKKEQKKTDRFIHLALEASNQALVQAGLVGEIFTQEMRERTGVYIGTGIGGLTRIYDEAVKYAAYVETDEKHPASRTSPFFVPGLIANQAPGLVAIKFGLKGPNAAVSTACATGSQSIGDAMRAIQNGSASIMLAGGTEATITELGIGGFAAMKAISFRNDDPSTASRPFSQGRDGFVMSEGAAVLVLEERTHAMARGATILAELVGYGAACDAFSMYEPDESGYGARTAVYLALKDARLSPSDIGYLNAHATSTPKGDVIECLAIREVFGEAAQKMFVSSTKGSTGHLIGAAGAIEAAFAILALREQVIPPTANLTELDPECEGLQIVGNTARETSEMVFAMSNSFGFGGTNSCLAFMAHR